MRFTPQIRAIPWLVTRPIAHRGLHDKRKGIVENSAGAFAAAMAGGYAIECDLQIAAGGEAVVFHDDTLDRVMEASGPVRTRTAAELRKLTFRNGNDRIQTLPELLQQVDGRVPLIMELKSHWDGDDTLVKVALDDLADYQGPHSLMSFDPDQIEAAAVLSPDTVRGIVADRVTNAYYRHMCISRRLELRSLSHVARTQPHFISFHTAGLPFAPVSLGRASGFPVIAWTIRSAEAASRALSYCDQITFEGYLS